MPRAKDSKSDPYGAVRGSILANADAETLRKIAAGRRKAREDQRLMERWAQSGFSSGVESSDEDSSLYTTEGYEESDARRAREDRRRPTITTGEKDYEGVVDGG